MKILIFLIFICSAYGQNPEKKTSTETKTENETIAVLTDEEKKRIQNDLTIKGRDYMLIAKYINNEYIEKPKKEHKKLKADFEKYRTKLATAKTDSAKNLYKEKMKDIKLKFDIHDLWIKYHKVYLIKNQAYFAKDNNRYKEAKKYLKKAEKEYTKQTAKSFPRFESEFYTKYEKKLELLRKQYTN